MCLKTGSRKMFCHSPRPEADQLRVPPGCPYERGAQYQPFLATWAPFNHPNFSSTATLQS